MKTGIYSLLMLPIIVVSSLSAVARGGVLNPGNNYLVTTDNGNTTDVQILGSGTGQDDSFVNVVKGAVNWVLGILALIALIYLMRGGFQMVTSGGNDDAYGKGFTILKHGATGLILIGVAWFIISIIFWLVNQIASGSTPGAAGTQT